MLNLPTNQIKADRNRISGFEVDQMMAPIHASAFSVFNLYGARPDGP